MKKPKLLLLDADIVVFAHQFGIWHNLTIAYEVHVPATVIDTEARFFDSKDGTKAINLNAEESAGSIKRVEASTTQVSETFDNFEATFLAALHDGEKEGIAVLRAEADSGMVFCTGDMIAVESVAMLGLSASCLSFEEVLQMAGLMKLVKNFMPHLKKDAHDYRVERGRIRRTTGECFKKPPLSI